MSSKWRPSPLNCLYVIPDIHGSISCLQAICDRILPLRKSDGGKDKLVFLGDYIDRHPDSHLVIDYLIETQKKFPGQVEFLMGNHELMMLQCLDLDPNKKLTLQAKASTERMWMGNGGIDTVMGYMLRNGIISERCDLPLHRIRDLIPKEHVEFLQNLKPYYEFEDYIFVHGGLDPTEPTSTHDVEQLAWDRELVKYVMNHITAKKSPKLPWDKTVVCGHSVQPNKKPIVQDNYLMLDSGAPRQLLVVELRTREAYMASFDKKRLVKFPLETTTEIERPFGRG